MSEKNQIATDGAPMSANHLDREETKKILTPFAFEIDKSLFGLPLAVPWKRGVALLIDFIIIAMLAETPGEVLALVVAITFFRLGSKKRAAKLGVKRGIRKLLLRYLGAFMLLVLAVSTVPDLLEQVTISVESANEVATSPNDDNKVAADNNAAANNKVDAPVEKVNKLTPQEKPDKQHDVIYQGVEWAKGIINDLGLSFGWAAFYFSVLTAIWHGQTPGKKLMKIRVIQLDGTPLSVWDSFGRYGGYGAGLATGLMGFMQIYWDPNRQAIHDKISSTVVIDLKKLEQNTR